MRRRSWIARVRRAIESPFYRYRNAKLIHSVRVGLAMLTSILVTTGIDIPHGIWASVTLLVVIGGLQHHGFIRKKAVERALGTVLGAMIGLVLIIVQAVTGSTVTTYVLISLIAGICGYHAIGKPGYIALLTAITMLIVVGHGDNLIDTGLWRSLNVMIGIVIALAFSFALPLHATYSWRYQLADNLRGCAHLYADLMSGKPLDADAHTEAFRRLGAGLVQLRSLMPSVAKEIQVPLSQFERIQRLHRAMLSTLEMLTDGLGRSEQQPVRLAFAARGTAVRGMLLAAARALRFGGARRTWSAVAALGPQQADQRTETTVPRTAVPAAGPLAPELQGPWWLALRFEEQVDEMRALLLAIEPQWNIERSHGHWPL